MVRTPNILVISSRIDPHADAILWGLRHLECKATLWDFADFPAIATASVSTNGYSDRTYDICVNDDALRGPFDVIWVRRTSRSTAKVNCHPDDVEIVQRESERFLANLLPYLGHADTTLINHPDKELVEDIKLRHLMIARQVGFQIPPTYMGNSPEAVRAFYVAHQRAIVYKAFRPGGWNNADETNTVLRTSRLDAEHVANDYAVSACPGIYQALVEKQYELRVTVFGEQVFAAKIDSQKKGQTVDWRYDFRPGEEPIDMVMLPESVAKKCLAMCKLLSLTFAAFDLILDCRGEFIFLELNPAGQFLFVEHHVPQIEMLDAFCHFLAGRRSHKSTLRLADYFVSPSYEALIVRDKAYQELMASTK
jgi:glutathione synthase/RimK-type ligase-like ATP-grasp enzyme